MITYAYTLSAAVVLCTIPIYIYTCRKSCSGSAWTRSVFLIVSAVRITLPANTTLIPVQFEAVDIAQVGWPSNYSDVFLPYYL